MQRPQQAHYSPFPGRTQPEGVPAQKKVGPCVVKCYVLAMLLLPAAVFVIGSWKVLQQQRAEQARNTSSPVTYANYFTDDGPELVKDIEVDHIWVTVPALNASHANAVFASNQIWFEYGHGGYMGTQVWREGVTDSILGFWFGGSVTQRVIFSIWDGDASHKAMPGADPISQANCERFGEEGEGSHCRMPYPMLPMQRVTVAVRHAGRSQLLGAGGDLWTGTVGDPATGEVRTIGSIFVPDIYANTGFGLIQPRNSVSAFQEYYRATGCEGQALSVVGILGPYFAERALVPKEVSPKYNDCGRGDVSACIPGYGCGRPGLLLSAGGDTLRRAAAEVNLWTGAAAGPGLSA